MPVKPESSDSSSDDDSSEEEVKVVAKKPAAAKAAPAPAAAKPAAKKPVAEDSDDDSDDDSSEEEAPKKPAAKAAPAPAAKAAPAPAAKPAAKKPVAEDSDDSDSDDSDDDSEEEAPKKPAAKAAPAPAAKAAPAPAAKKPVAEDSDDSDSDDSDDDSEEEAPKKPAAKAAPAPAAAKPAAKKPVAEDDEDDSDDSDDSEEEEEEEEEEAPVKRKRDEEPKAAPTVKRARTEEAAAAPAAAAGEGSAVFVKGLPFTSTEESVKAAFEGYGTITEFDLPKFEDSGRLRGVARITFASPAEANAACELNNSDFEGRSISVEIARPSFKAFNAGGGGSNAEPTNTVFLGNLPYDVDEDTLRSAFGACGEITRVRIATDRETGAPRGFGHLEFSDVEGAKAAVALAGTPLNGRPVRVDFAAERDPNSGGGGGGRGGACGDPVWACCASEPRPLSSMCWVLPTCVCTLTLRRAYPSPSRLSLPPFACCRLWRRPRRARRLRRARRRPRRLWR